MPTCSPRRGYACRTHGVTVEHSLLFVSQGVTKITFRHLPGQGPVRKARGGIPNGHDQAVSPRCQNTVPEQSSLRGRESRLAAVAGGTGTRCQTAQAPSAGGDSVGVASSPAGKRRRLGGARPAARREHSQVAVTRWDHGISLWPSPLPAARPRPFSCLLTSQRGMA